jgi:hypothetical protein
MFLSYVDFEKKKKDWGEFLEKSSIFHFGFLIGFISFVLFFFTRLKEAGYYLIFVSAFLYGFYCLFEMMRLLWERRKRS